MTWQRATTRRLNRLRYHRAVSIALRALAGPVARLSDAASRQIRRKVWINGGTAKYDGLTLRFPKNLGVGAATSIYWLGDSGFEPHTWAVLRPLIGRADRFADVGSYIGLYAVLAKKVNPDLCVWAFEPVPAIARENRRFLAANGIRGVVLHEVALSDAEGEATLFLPPSRYIETETTGTLRLDSWQASESGAEAITVHTRSLDALCRAYGWHPQVVKIDVEDYEASVLRGMSDTITNFRPLIVCEVLSRTHGNAETLEIIREHRYEIFAITGEGLFRQSDFHQGRPFENYVFVPDPGLGEYLPFSEMYRLAETVPNDG